MINGHSYSQPRGGGGGGGARNRSKVGEGVEGAGGARGLGVTMIIREGQQRER